MNDDALMAGIAAAQGRFYHRNSLYYSMALGASFLGSGIQRILLWLATTITRIGYRHVWLLPVGFVGSLLSLLLKGLQTITSFSLMGYIRRRIYASDELTKSLDLQEHLISYLETLAQGEDRQDGFFEKYQEQFPSAMQRIHQLEN